MTKEKIFELVNSTRTLVAHISEPERSLVFPIIFKIMLFGDGSDNVGKGKSTVTGSMKEDGKTEKDFKGLSGGMRLLIKEGFFREGKTIGDMSTELKRQMYRQPTTSYSAVLKTLITEKRILMRYKDKGNKNWKYAERK